MGILRVIRLPSFGELEVRIRHKPRSSCNW